MKTRVVSLSRISLERTLRTDFVYNNHFYDFDRDRVYYSFDDLFEIVTEKYDPQLLDGDFKYCQIGDVTKDGEIHPVQLNFDERNLLDEGYYKKIEKGDIICVNENDILVSFLLPQDVSIIGKMARITGDISEVFFTNAFIRIRPKKTPEILFYALKTLFYNDLVAVSRIRKGYTGYSTLDESDLRLLQFDKRTVDTLLCNSKRLNKEIQEREERIRVLGSQIESTQTIIDKVFQEAFILDYQKFEELKRIKKYHCYQGVFSNNPDLRFSAKFHREAGDFVMHQLTNITDKKIKHFLSEPIVLGASISPEDYFDDGEYCYISMATIKEWHFDAACASRVSKEYSDTKLEKTVRKNDIILARSGEGTIGKVALIEDDDIQGIFADFTMRIRLKDYNPVFAYYYFRTCYFQYLIEIYKKGLGNNTNIFPVVIQEFPMIDISLNEQQRIVDEIHAEIAKQDSIKTAIASLREEIDTIIRNTLLE